MLLQVNDRGSWRNVIRFIALHEKSVRRAAETLAIAGDVRGFQITKDGIVIAHMQPPYYLWEAA